jgi:hypothetical protein
MRAVFGRHGFIGLVTLLLGVGIPFLPSASADYPCTDPSPETISAVGVRVGRGSGGGTHTEYVHRARGPVTYALTSPQEAQSGINTYLWVVSLDCTERYCEPWNAFIHGYSTHECHVPSGFGFRVIVGSYGYAPNDWILTFEGLPPTECSDGEDNDADGQADFPGDTGCTSPQDDAERGDCRDHGAMVETCVTTGDVVVESLAIREPDTVRSEDKYIAGYLDAYRFLLPSGGSVVVPCVTLYEEGQAAEIANPCRQAGGTFDSRRATLVFQRLELEELAEGYPLPQVAVCEASLDILVAGFGVESMPGYALC